MTEDRFKTILSMWAVNGMFPSANDEDMAYLRENMDNAPTELRSEIIKYLSHSGDPKAIPILRDHLNDDDPYVREESIAGLSIHLNDIGSFRLISDRLFIEENDDVLMKGLFILSQFYDEAISYTRRIFKAFKELF